LITENEEDLIQTMFLLPDFTFNGLSEPITGSWYQEKKPTQKWRQNAHQAGKLQHCLTLPMQMMKNIP
jgi:hypothetical protein